MKREGRGGRFVTCQYVCHKPAPSTLSLITSYRKLVSSVRSSFSAGEYHPIVVLDLPGWRRLGIHTSSGSSSTRRASLGIKPRRQRTVCYASRQAASKESALSHASNPLRATFIIK